MLCTKIGLLLPILLLPTATSRVGFRVMFTLIYYTSLMNVVLWLSVFIAQRANNDYFN